MSDRLPCDISGALSRNQRNTDPDLKGTTIINGVADWIPG
jgi:hypothetical protein